MSIKYLYVTQKPENIYAVTIYNTNAPMKGLSGIKFVIPHFHNDPLVLVDNFLTTHGFLFMPFNPPIIGGSSVIKGKTYDLREKPFPLADLYLALGLLQSDVLMRFDEKLNAQINTRVDSKLVERIIGLETEIDHLRESVNRQVSSIGLDFRSAISAIKDDLTECLLTVKTDLEVAIKSLDIRVETLETSIVTEDRMQAFNERIKGFSKVISENIVSIPLFTEVNSLRNKLETVANNVGNMETMVSDIETSVNGLKMYVTDEFINVKTIVSEQIDTIAADLMVTKQSISHKHFINDEYFNESSDENSDHEEEENEENHGTIIEDYVPKAVIETEDPPEGHEEDLSRDLSEGLHEDREEDSNENREECENNVQKNNVQKNNMTESKWLSYWF